MPRPMWKGAVSFGLVTIPVGLYSATERQAEIAFRQLHKKDHVPIEYKRVCSAEGVEVAWQDIEKGYEYAKGQFVVVTDEDLAKAKVAGTQTIEIREFVPAEQIDFAHFEAPYWLAPEKAGTKAYALLRDALAKSGRVGIATFVMREREHLAALRPEGRGIMLTTMRFADEIRSAEDLALPEEGEHPKRRWISRSSSSTPSPMIGIRRSTTTLTERRCARQSSKRWTAKKSACPQLLCPRR